MASFAQSATEQPLQDKASGPTMPARTAESASKEHSSMARRRYQTGRIFVRGKNRRVFVGRWRADVIQADGAILRAGLSIVPGHADARRALKDRQRRFEPILTE